VLTGCRKGAVPAALIADGPAAARRELLRLVDAFGRDRVLVELWDHGDPLDSARNDALAELAHRERVECVATNNVHYATPAQRRLATALAAVRSRRSLDEIDPWLPRQRPAPTSARGPSRPPVPALSGCGRAGRRDRPAAAFDLSLVAPKLPPFPCPSRPDGTR
jgi:error-prone DNA polymerase